MSAVETGDFGFIGKENYMEEQRKRRTGSDARREWLHIRLSKKEKYKLECVAEDLDESVSEVARRAIIQYINNLTW